MAEIKARKITYEELFNSTTMFYMNPKYEAEIEKIVQAKTSEISVGLQSIKDKESLTIKIHLIILLPLRKFR